MVGAYQVGSQRHWTRWAHARWGQHHHGGDSAVPQQAAAREGQRGVHPGNQAEPHQRAARPEGQCLLPSYHYLSDYYNPAISCEAGLLNVPVGRGTLDYKVHYYLSLEVGERTVGVEVETG